MLAVVRYVQVAKPLSEVAPQRLHSDGRTKRSGPWKGMKLACQSAKSDGVNATMEAYLGKLIISSLPSFNGQGVGCLFL